MLLTKSSNTFDPHQYEVLLLTLLLPSPVSASTPAAFTALSITFTATRQISANAFRKQVFSAEQSPDATVFDWQFGQRVTDTDIADGD